MTEPREERAAERIDRIVAEALAGRRLKATPHDAAEREAIRVAASLAGIRDGYPRMSPAFRRRLARLLEKEEAPAWINRRTALAAAFGLAAGAVGGAMSDELRGLIAASHPTPAQQHGAPTTSRSIMEPRQEVARWVDTGLTVADLAEGVPKRVAAGAIGAFLVRRGDHVVGMSSYCTHLPCELVWQAGRKQLNCPCHNQSFDIDGQSTREGYPLPALPFVKVRVRNDGRVEVLGT